MAETEFEATVEFEKKSRKDGAYMRHRILPRKSGRPLPPIPWSMDLRQHLLETEAEHVERALQDSGGVIAQAARMLGVKRSGLNFRIEKLGIDVTLYRTSKEKSCEP